MYTSMMIHVNSSNPPLPPLPSPLSPPPSPPPSLKADYRMDGKEELICCSVDGEIRGYLPGESVQKRPLNSDPGSDPSPELRSLEELNRKRQVMSSHEGAVVRV